MRCTTYWRTLTFCCTNAITCDDFDFAEPQRYEKLIASKGIIWASHTASSERIDEINILQASANHKIHVKYIHGNVMTPWLVDWLVGWLVGSLINAIDRLLSTRAPCDAYADCMPGRDTAADRTAGR